MKLIYDKNSTLINGDEISNLISSHLVNHGVAISVKSEILSEKLKN